MAIDKQLRAMQELRNIIVEFLSSHAKDGDCAEYLQNSEFIETLKAANFVVVNIIHYGNDYTVLLNESNVMLAPALVMREIGFTEAGKDWYDRYVMAYYNACATVMMYS